MINIGFLPDPTVERDLNAGRKVARVGASSLRQCPKCGQPTLVRQEGCDTCTNCGHSKCS
jgi:ribonucleoside-diphosphate reductase alpha chain